MIVRAYSFRFDVAVSPNQVQAAADALPIGDGITFNRLRGIYEDGHLVQFELNIGDPVTQDRIDLGESRMRDLLTKVTASPVRSTGLDAGATDQQFDSELNKITPPGGSVFGELTAQLKAIGQGTQTTALYIAAAAAAVLVLYLVVRR